MDDLEKKGSGERVVPKGVLWFQQGFFWISLDDLEPGLYIFFREQV
jgi:hypothetical protein